MGRFEEHHVPFNDNDVIDYEEVVTNAVQAVNNGLDAIEQIVAMLPEGYEISINFEEAGDVENEGITMSFEDNSTEEELYPEDNDTVRQIQLKSELIYDDYQENSTWSYEEADFNDYDYSYSQDNDRSLESVDQVLHNLASYTDLYGNDPLVQEEIAYEIAELGHLISSEISGMDAENGQMEISDEDYEINWDESGE